MKTTANFGFSYCTDCAAACASAPVSRIMDTARLAVSIVIPLAIIALGT